MTHAGAPSASFSSRLHLLVEEHAGHVSREELWGIDDALLTVLGLR